MILIKKRRTSTPLAKRPTYLARLARSADEVRAAQRLRFEGFNLELNEALAESHFTGLDIDPFDAVCQHLVSRERPDGRNRRHLPPANGRVRGGKHRLLQRARI